MFISYFLSSIILSAVISYGAYKIALHYRLFDNPESARKHHQKPTPYIGGVVLFFAFWIVILCFIFLNQVTGSYLKYLVGLFVGSTLLFVIGIVDDRRNLSSGIKFAIQVLSALIIIAAGVGITFINNPLGGFIFLDQIKIPISLFGGIYTITLLADLFALVWIVGMINVVNFLDGLDGLASGVAAIAFFVLYIMSINPLVAQPLSGIIALIALGAVLGFLPYNLNPARMFMGDSGSTLLGFLLAVLAIIAGGKVATALLVLGLPIFDGLWVVASRMRRGVTPWTPGRDHLHHKLIDCGLSKRWVVIIFWTITALFGGIALLSGTWAKFIALIILIVLLSFGMVAVSRLSAAKRSL